MSQMMRAKFPKSCSRKFYLSRSVRANSSISATVDHIPFIALIIIDTYLEVVLQHRVKYTVIITSPEGRRSCFYLCLSVGHIAG